MKLLVSLVPLEWNLLFSRRWGTVHMGVLFYVVRKLVEPREFRKVTNSIESQGFEVCEQTTVAHLRFVQYSLICTCKYLQILYDDFLYV